MPPGCVRQRTRTGGFSLWGGMGKRLTDKQIETIRQLGLLGQSERDIAAVVGCSASTVHNHMPTRSEIAQCRAEKKEQLAAEVEAEVRDLMVTVQRRLLTALADEGKIAEATLQQVGTTFGIVTDKLRTGDNKPTEIIKHQHDWREEVAAAAVARGLDPDAILAATEQAIAERYGVVD